MVEAIQRPFAVYFNKNAMFAHGEASYRQGDRRQQTVPGVHLKIRKQNSLLFNADSTIFSPPAAAVFIFLRFLPDNYLNIYRTDFRESFRINRIMPVADQCEITFFDS